MTERIAYNEYAELKNNTLITMRICPSVQDSTDDWFRRRVMNVELSTKDTHLFWGDKTDCVHGGKPS